MMQNLKIIYPFDGPNNDLIDDQQVDKSTYLTNPANKHSMPVFKVFNKNGRVYPDVFTIRHICAIVVQESTEYVDGTSCSSPVEAGLLVVLHAQMGVKQLVLVASLLYTAYQQDKTTFRDIMKGFSGCTEEQCFGAKYGFRAVVGYDICSGMDTPQITTLLQVVK